MTGNRFQEKTGAKKGSFVKLWEGKSSKFILRRRSFSHQNTHEETVVREH